MSTTATSQDANAIQLARAERLQDLFEPWSLRKLEAKTGIGRGTLQGRFNGTTPLNMADIELLAPIIRMTPTELFVELLRVGPENQPGITERNLASVTNLRPNDRPARTLEAVITPIRKAI